LPGGRMDYLKELSCWSLELDRNRIRDKIKIQI
jgi:hypothetical protein